MKMELYSRPARLRYQRKAHMSLQSKIHYDYDKIKKILFDIEALGRKPSKLRKPLLGMLRQEYLVLQKAEEETLYDVLEDEKKTADLVHELEDENETIDGLLDKLDKTPDTDSGWFQNFSKLENLMVRHIEKEEKKLLPRSKKLLDSAELEDIEEELVEAKRDNWNISLQDDVIEIENDFANSVRADETQPMRRRAG